MPSTPSRFDLSSQAGRAPRPSPLRRLAFAFLLALTCQLPAWAGDVVYLNSPQGEERLVGARLRSQFFAVEPYVESQKNLAFCGPASIAATLNSLDIPRPAVEQLYPYPFFTQDNIFTPANQRIKSYIQVSSHGMTLAELAAFMNNLGVKARPYYADQMDLGQLRSLARTTLANPQARIIVNYNRQPLGQAGTGHMSPLVAYDPGSDSVLLLDVAKFKYPPAWIALADLWAALRTVDPDSGKSRGLVVIEKNPEPPGGH